MVARDYSTVTKALSITATSGGSSGDVLYTVPPAFDAEIDLLQVINGDSSNKTMTIQWYHASSQGYSNIINTKTITANDVYKVIDGDVLHLHAGDKLIVAAGTANELVATISVEEFYDPNR